MPMSPVYAVQSEMHEKSRGQKKGGGKQRRHKKEEEAEGDEGGRESQVEASSKQ